MSWAEIKKAINSNISKSLDVLITEKSNELLSKLNSVYNTVTVKGNIPSVKSVQRGKVSKGITATGVINEMLWSYDNSKSAYIDININQVNTNKTIIIFNETIEIGNIGGLYYELLNSSTIRMYFTSGNYTGPTRYKTYEAYFWQAIEFY